MFEMFQMLFFIALADYYTLTQVNTLHTGRLLNA